MGNNGHIDLNLLAFLKNGIMVSVYGFLIVLQQDINTVILKELGERRRAAVGEVEGGEGGVPTKGRHDRVEPVALHLPTAWLARTIFE